MTNFYANSFLEISVRSVSLWLMVLDEKIIKCGDEGKLENPARYLDKARK